MSSEISEKLSDENRRRFEQMALERPIEAVKQIHDLSGCPLVECKRWVDAIRNADFLERRRIYEENLPPCPYCGEKLRTPFAKQCRHCLRDWHDENELKYLK